MKLSLNKLQPEARRRRKIGMEIATLATIGGIAVLLVLSGFFSSSETALTAASRPRMHQMEAKGSRRAGW